jgi:hypothetical protein
LNVPTARTRFAGREIAVHLDESLARSCRLVFKELGEHPPAHLSNSFRKAMILHHPLDVQILDGDDLVFVNQPQGFWLCFGGCSL